MVSSNVYAETMAEAYDRLAGLGYERGDGMDLANHGPMGAEALSTQAALHRIPARALGGGAATVAIRHN